MKRVGNLIALITSDENLSDSYDTVLRNVKDLRQRAKLAAMKDTTLARLKTELANGTFRIKGLRELVVVENKRRLIKAPCFSDRVGCHAVMRVVDDALHKSLISTATANVRGKGMHALFAKMRSDIRQDPKGTAYFYKCDIRKYYESIDQTQLVECLRRRVKDKTVLPILEGFATCTESGLAIGMRSSQCFGSIYLSDIDHYFKETLHVRYYYRYCDDIVMLHHDKRQLWQWRDILKAKLTEKKLEIKPDECVRPLSEGLDFLGFVNYGTHARLRKRIKQRFARKMAKVRSRKRRQQLMGSFKGMAVHAECNHLYYSITHQKMRKFSEMGVSFTPADGKKRFPGKVTRLGAIVNKTIEVHDYEVNVKTSQGEDRYIVSFRDPQTGEWGKFFTASEEMKSILDQISDIEDGFPFETVIVSEVFDGNKIKYRFT